MDDAGHLRFVGGVHRGSILVTESPRSAQTEGVAVLPSRPTEFDAIFVDHAAYVGLSLLRLGIPERDLEDVAQDVFVVVHRHLGDYDSARPLRPWLFGIAVRVALAYRRRAGYQREEMRGDVEAADLAPLPDERLETERKRRLALAALRMLTDDRRAVLVMHDIDGHGMPDIARELQIPLNTGYSRLRLARTDFARAATGLRDAHPQGAR